MSYLKLFKVCSDFAVGKQTVAQAIDNNQAQFDLYSSKHANGVNGLNTGGFQNPFKAPGRHDDILIARTTVRIIIKNPNTSHASARTVLTGPMLGAGSVRQIVAGQWRIAVVTRQLFGAVAQVEAASAIDRKATCYITYDPAVGPVVTVSTWEISAGVWALTDLDFSVTMWAQGD